VSPCGPVGELAVWVWAFQRSPFAKLLGQTGADSRHSIPSANREVASAPSFALVHCMRLSDAVRVLGRANATPVNAKGSCWLGAVVAPAHIAGGVGPPADTASSGSHTLKSGTIAPTPEGEVRWRSIDQGEFSKTRGRPTRGDRTYRIDG
jgi:hypothetical protein